MNVFELISEKQRKEEVLNQYVIETHTNEAVKKYYSQILDAAESIGLITLTERDQIALVLFKCIEQKASGYVRGIVNQLHAVAIYLSSKSNVEALQEMINIKTATDAENFLSNVEDFLRKSLNGLKVKIAKIRSKLQSGDPQIEVAYNVLRRYVISLEDWNGNSTNFDDIFTELLHFNHLDTYIFLKAFHQDEVYCGVSIIGKLNIVADAFETELSIMKKVGFKEILKYRREKTEEQKRVAQRQVDDLIQKIDQERQKLQESYDKRKKEFQAAEARLEELYAQYDEYWGDVEDDFADSEEEEDEMMEEALGEEQFEEFQELLTFLCDAEEKLAKYRSKFSSVMERFEEKAEKSLEKLRNEQSEVIEDYSIVALSLFDVLQEFAYYVLATQEDEGASNESKVGSISTKQAIDIALEKWDFLTAEEICYLEGAKSGA